MFSSLKAKMSDVPSARTLNVAGLSLLVLLALTTAVAYLPFSHGKLIIALGISWVKMLVVALVFMELRQAGKTIWVFAIAGFLWIAVLAGLTLADFLTRISPAG